jgi:hypothetical protein
MPKLTHSIAHCTVLVQIEKIKKYLRIGHVTSHSIFEYFGDELFSQNISPQSFQSPAPGLFIQHSKPLGVPAVDISSQPFVLKRNLCKEGKFQENLLPNKFRKWP